METSMWVLLGVPGISATAAIVAAFIAAQSARKTKERELRAQRFLEEERRVAPGRSETYGPLLELVRAVMDATATGGNIEEVFDQDALSRFLTWIAIYGSDESVRATLRFMQGSYHSPPAVVAVRHMYELILAARRDLGRSDTEISALDLAAIRINDIYEGDLHAQMAEPLEEFYERVGWMPPWSA